MFRRHHALRDLFVVIGREAGFVSATEAYEPAWTRELEVEQARLGCRFDGPPSDPLTYGDVAVSHPESTAWLNRAADLDAATAEGAAQGKAPPLSGLGSLRGRLVPLSVETLGCWGKEELDWLRDTAHTTCKHNPQLAYLA